MKTATLSIAFLLCMSFAFAQSVPLGPMGNLPFTTATVAADTATLTNAQMVGLLTGTPTAGATYTTPTAAQLCTYFRNIIPPITNNYSWHLWVKNTSAGSNTITVAGGTGVTNVGARTAAQNNVRHFVIAITNCTAGSEAASLVSLETAAF